MEQKYSTHAIVDTALMSALTVVFALILNYVPLIGIAAFFVLPIPIIILGVKYDVKFSILSVIVSGIFVSIFLGVISGVSLTIMYGLCGIVLSVCIKKNKRWIFTMCSLVISNLFSVIVELFLTIYVLSNSNIHKELNEMVKLIKETMGMYEKMGLNLEGSSSYQMLANINADMLIKILPAAIILSVIIMTIIYYKVSVAVLRRLKIEVPSEVKFLDWHINVGVIAAIVVIICASMFLKEKGVPYSEYVLYTSFIVFMFTMIIQGLSVIDFYLIKKFKMKSNLAMVICIFILISYLSIFTFILGIADLILDFRGKDEYSLGSMLRAKKSNK